jgi:hypothetical protein
MRSKVDETGCGRRKWLANSTNVYRKVIDEWATFRKLCSNGQQMKLQG